MIRFNTNKRCVLNAKLIARSYCGKKLDNESSIGNDNSETASNVECENRKAKQSNVSNSSDKIHELIRKMVEQNAQSTISRIPKNEDLGSKFKNRQKQKIKEEPPVPPDVALKEAAAAVAESFGDKRAEIEADLLSKAFGDDSVKSSMNWSELISGMKVDTEKSDVEEVETRSQQVKKAFRKTNYPSESYKSRTPSKPLSTQYKIKQVELLKGEPLNIFKDITTNNGIELNTWNQLEEYESEIAVAHPPTNYFEKMIKWTKEGKIWKFPIDNEQGLDEEQKVHFSEHIFLENHLEDWCPQRGPIRHYMELVCVGLSKNPYLPAKDKKEHIMWYKNYFESKKDLLIEIGAYPKPTEIQQNVEQEKISA